MGLLGSSAYTEEMPPLLAGDAVWYCMRIPGVRSELINECNNAEIHLSSGCYKVEWCSLSSTKAFQLGPPAESNSPKETGQWCSMYVVQAWSGVKDLRKVWQCTDELLTDSVVELTGPWLVTLSTVTLHAMKCTGFTSPRPTNSMHLDRIRITG